MRILRLVAATGLQRRISSRHATARTVTRDYASTSLDTTAYLLAPRLAVAASPAGHPPIHCSLHSAILASPKPPATTASIGGSGEAHASLRFLPGSSMSFPIGCSPSQAYEHLVAQGKVDRDERQIAALLALDKLHAQLALLDAANVAASSSVRGSSGGGGNGSSSSGLWDTLFGGMGFSGGSPAARTPRGSGPPPPRGVYLYGGTGCGKTFVMDVFYTALSTRAKRRVHFHAFMLDVHARLHGIRSSGHRGDPIPVLAAEMASGVRIMCFDEMQVTDVGDALIMRRLFDGLFAAGLVVVVTSNRPPRDLYANGLQRELFMPFIAALEERCAVMKLDSPTDYRLLIAARDREAAAVLAAAAAASSNTAPALFPRGTTWYCANAQLVQRSNSVGGAVARTHLHGGASSGGSGSSSSIPPSVSAAFEAEWRRMAQPVSASTSEHSVPHDVETSHRSQPSLRAGSTLSVIRQSVGAAAPEATSMAPPLPPTAAATAAPSSHAGTPASATSTPSPHLPEREVSLSLAAQGRQVHVARALPAARAARFTFDELCRAPLYSGDYAAIAASFAHVFLEGVPALTLSDRNEVRRLITLVDVLYEARVRLVVSAEEAPWSTLAPVFKGDPGAAAGASASAPAVVAASAASHGPPILRRSVGGGVGGGTAAAASTSPSSASVKQSPATAQYDELFAFDRTVSRLIEMGGAEYGRRGKWERH